MMTPEQIKSAADMDVSKYVRTSEDRSASASAGSRLTGFVAGAQWMQEQYRWISPKEKLPEKTGVSTYEHIPCLVQYRGNITILMWNCEEQCWDTEDCDDYQCDPIDVDYYMPLSVLPETPKPNQP